MGPPGPKTGVLAVLVLLALIIGTSRSFPPARGAIKALPAGRDVPASLSTPPSAGGAGTRASSPSAPGDRDPANRVRGTVERGQTLGAILGVSGMGYPEIQRICDAAHPHYNLRLLIPGRQFHFDPAEDGGLLRFEYEIDDLRRLVITRKEDSYDTEVRSRPVTRRSCVTSGTIRSSLFEAVSDAGEGPSLALLIADLYGWEVDFFTDIRRGDSFRVAVEKIYRAEGFLRYGRILAAELNVDGRIMKSFLHATEDGSEGYFHEDGNSVRRQFLKAPLAFDRITSLFSRSRMHPILNRRLPHFGVDYSAPRGTPVRAVGDGRVKESGRSGGAGLKVVVQHPNGYQSSYLHLSRLGPGILPGSRVAQGDTVGYVGSTGLSTGPHLDFRMLRDGRPVNPLTIESPPATPIPEAERVRFKQTVETYTVLLSRTGDHDIPVVTSCILSGTGVY